MKRSIGLITVVMILISILSLQVLAMDSTDLLTLVEPKYERANLFSDGMALVLRDNKYFYIDKTGKEVISLPYKANDIDPKDFHEGVALITLGVSGNEPTHTVIAIDKSGKTVFKLDNVYASTGNLRPGSLIGYSILLPGMEYAEHYYIDTRGHKYSSKEYNDIYDFNADGLALFKKGQKFGVIDRSGRTLLKAEYSNIKFLQGGYMLVEDDSRGIIGEWAVIDKNGKETIGMGRYISFSISDKSLIVSDGKACKLLDFSGKVLYESTGYIDGFSEELASTTVNGDRVIIDTLGHEVFRCRAESGFFNFKMSEGLATILKDSRWVIIDKNFKEVAALKNNGYAIVDPFKDGMAAIGTYDNKWGFIDSDGQEIVTPQYESVEDFSTGLAIIVSDDTKYGVINKSGKVILEPVYERVETGNGLIAAKKDGIYTLMDDTGKFILKSDIVIGIADRGPYGPVETRAFAACIDDKTGKAYYINKFGDRFDEIADAGAGITKTVVRLDAGVYRYGFCNFEGKVIAPPVYYYVSDFNDYIEGAAVLGKTDYFYGVVDREGKVIIPFEYKFIGEFVNGIGCAQKIKYGYIDEKGNMVVPFIYDFTSTFKDGFAIVGKDGKFGFIKELTKK